MIVITKDGKMSRIPTGMLEQFTANGWEKVGTDEDVKDTNFTLGKQYGALGPDMMGEDVEEEVKESRPKKVSQMSVSELKEALDKYGVEYKESDVKEDLKRLLYQYRKSLRENGSE